MPQQTIEEDFTASNVYLGASLSRSFEPLAKAAGKSVDEVKKEMALRPELIHIFFKTIKAKYGSIENFMDKELGVGKQEVAILKKKYTT